jgi:hypothetical protein
MITRSRKSVHGCSPPLDVPLQEEIHPARVSVDVVVFQYVEGPKMIKVRCFLKVAEGNPPRVRRV